MPIKLAGMPVSDFCMHQIMRSEWLMQEYMDITSNYSIPNHKLIKRTSRTGMSSVFLAESSERQEPVIVKILEFDPDDKEDIRSIKRFVMEYKLLKHLNHPNVANIYGRHIDRDYSCIMMEYFRMGDLSKQILTGISTDQAINYARQIAFGLQDVHSRNIVHRDIKPRNILIRENNTLAISDFGIARVMGKSYGLTLQGVILGSPYYMSPEQIDNTTIDHRSDLYSLGAVFYEMLTGKKPFRGDSLMKIFYSHLNDPIPKLPALLQEYQPIIDRLMAKKAEDRFQTASELLENLKGIASSQTRSLELIMA